MHFGQVFSFQGFRCNSLFSCSDIFHCRSQQARRGEVLNPSRTPSEKEKLPEIHTLGQMIDERKQQLMLVVAAFVNGTMTEHIYLYCK